MRVYWRKPSFPLPRPPALAIGNFDGVHRGHQAIIAALKDHAAREDLTPVAMSFFPHPRTVITGQTLPLISTLRDRAFWLAQYGVQHWFLRAFTTVLRRSEPREFVRHYLCDTLGIRHLFVGDDFRFGYRGAGDCALLRELGQQWGFAVTAMPSICAEDGARISSSAIRQALADHDLERAQQLLGHPLTLTGRIIHGAARGRKLNAPTANLSVPPFWCAPNGVYAVRIALNGQSFLGVANVGVAPTFGGQTRRLEVHSFTHWGEVYGQILRVELVAFLRPERTFDHFDALRAQIHRDIQCARELLGAPPLHP